MILERKGVDKVISYFDLARLERNFFEYLILCCDTNFLAPTICKDLICKKIAYEKRGGEHSPPLPSYLAIYRCTHDIEIGFLSYISIGIEIISDD